MAEFVKIENEEKEGTLEELDDEDDEEDDFPEENQIQLGFIDSENQNFLFLKKNWKEWDGGFVGGKPVGSSLSFLLT
jgi:hypothetical protein